MQGLFKLGIVGTEEQFQSLFQQAQGNDLLESLGLEEYAQEYGQGLRTTQMYGLEPFLDKFKLVMENEGSGNIHGLQEAVAEISKVVPELEVVYFEQYIDYSRLDEWMVTYSPAGNSDTDFSADILTKGDGTPEDLIDWDEVTEYGTADWFDLDDVMRYADEYFNTGYDEDEEEEETLQITREILEYYIVSTLEGTEEEPPEDYEEVDEHDLYAFMCDYCSDRSSNLPLTLTTGEAPSIDYLAQLFDSCRGLSSPEFDKYREERFERERRQQAAEKMKTVPFDKIDVVTVKGNTFVLTGDFSHCNDDRDAIKELIVAQGGRCTGAVSGKTNYLVIGSLGGFGEKKIEDVQAQREKGKDIKIIREDDLFAALEN